MVAASRSSEIPLIVNEAGLETDLSQSAARKFFGAHFLRFKPLMGSQKGRGLPERVCPAHGSIESGKTITVVENGVTKIAVGDQRVVRQNLCGG